MCFYEKLILNVINNLVAKLDNNIIIIKNAESKEGDNRSNIQLLGVSKLEYQPKVIAKDLAKFWELLVLARISCIETQL